MEFLTGLYLFYSFLAFYFLFLFILIYLNNRKTLYDYPKITKEYSLSVIVPCYNESKSIRKSIEALRASDYPNLQKIIIVDDCSQDNSWEVIQKIAEEFPEVIAVQTPSNTGKASGSKNYGAKFVDTELIGYTDADSYVKPDSIRKMIGFFDDEKVGAVTSNVLVYNRKTFFSRLQSIEYQIISFTRKLLQYVDGIYVAPGPLGIYRKSAFDEVGGFDETNLTEDIEIIWNLIDHGYLTKMSLTSRVHSICPEHFRPWFSQRIRWNVGGIQTIVKYKHTFFKFGILGLFVLPLFVSSWLIGIWGLIILTYRIGQRLIVNFLSARYSIEAQTAVITLHEINLNPSILLFFGLVLLFMGLTFTMIGLIYTREKEFKNPGLLGVLVYMFVYLLLYPPLLVVSAYRYATGKFKW